MIYMDSNEPNEIYEMLKNINLDVVKRKNNVVDEYDISIDYILEVKEKTIAIERKTWEDMVASIEDGRYSMQRYVMYKCFPLSFFVIVGDWNDVLLHRKISVNNLIGILYSTPLKTKGKVSVIQLNDISEFILMIKLMHNTLEKEKIEVLPKPSVNKSDLHELKIMMLACVPGIGTETAKKLINHYGSIDKIVNADKKDLSKVIGKKRSEKVWSFFRI